MGPFNGFQQKNSMGLTSISQETRVFLQETPYGLHTHCCGFLILTRPITPYSQHGWDRTSQKRVSSIAISPPFSRKTHSCGWQGPSTPRNFQVFDSSLNSTLKHARQHPQPTHSPMHNGLDLDFPRNQRFPA